VSISGFSFKPASLEVSVGTIVVWTNQDSAAHTVSADDSSFESGTMATGGTFSHTFTKAGTYPYYCAFHPSMRATVVVK
jgi:plastocyanin